MDNLEKNIRQLVQDVIRDMNLYPPKEEAGLKKAGVFTDIGEAIHAASLAFGELNKLTLEIRKKIIANIRKTALANNEIISRMAHEETGLGRWEDKVIKNELGIRKTPGVEDIVSESFSDDDGLTPKGQGIKKRLMAKGFPEARAITFAKMSQKTKPGAFGKQAVAS